MKPYHYITFNDCEQMCRNMHQDPNSSLLILSGPKGASIEMGEVSGGESLLTMNANGNGKLEVYSCSAREGVHQVKPHPK